MFGPQVIYPQPDKNLIYLAAHAPKDIPGWFQPDVEPAPEIKGYDFMASSDSVRTELARYYGRTDGWCEPSERLRPLRYDRLCPEAKAIVDTEKAQAEAYKEWRNNRDKQRGLQWPAYWARMMIEQCDVQEDIMIRESKEKLKTGKKP